MSGMATANRKGKRRRYSGLRGKRRSVIAGVAGSREEGLNKPAAGVFHGGAPYVLNNPTSAISRARLLPFTDTYGWR